MYEEEDDDLPLQYRRLTAHLQTGSADFNRRLAAYLTNQVAMRSAMEQMVNNSYAQQYPGMSQQYPQQQRPNMFMPQQPIAQSPMSMYRQAPYPSPYRQTHNRTQSAVIPQNPSGSTSPTPQAPTRGMDQRRMSTPVAMHQAHQRIATDGMQPNADYARQTQSATMPQEGQFPPSWQDMGPFTTQLPPEAQQMLGPALNSGDPFASMLMNGSDQYMQSQYYPWGNLQQGVKGMSDYSGYQGMSQTLAPSALDNNYSALAANGVKQESSAPSSGLDFGFSQESKGLHLNNFPPPMTRQGSQHLPSGQVTPGDGFWDNFVHEPSWSEEVVAAQ